MESGMAKIGDRETERRHVKEARFMEEQARQEAEARLAAERRAHYEAKRRAAAVTKVEAPAEAVTKIKGVCDDIRLASVTKFEDGNGNGNGDGKAKRRGRGRGRPRLLETPLTPAERTRRWRLAKAERAKLMECGRDG